MKGDLCNIKRKGKMKKKKGKKCTKMRVYHSLHGKKPY